jgi:TrmH family RNA methyltransferase
VLDRLEERGVRLLATSARGDTRYDDCDLKAPVAFVFGSEGSGLVEEVAARATARLRIPLAPPVDSLNVGVAAGLVLFEAARQRGFSAGGRGR